MDGSPSPIEKEGGIPPPHGRGTLSAAIKAATARFFLSDSGRTLYPKQPSSALASALQ